MKAPAFAFRVFEASGADAIRAGHRDLLGTFVVGIEHRQNPIVWVPSELECPFCPDATLVIAMNTPADSGRVVWQEGIGSPRMLIDPMPAGMRPAGCDQCNTVFYVQHIPEIETEAQKHQEH